MRSELVIAAAGQVRNRYVLMHSATAIMRKFHRPNRDRVQQSINDSIAGFAEGRYLISPDGQLIQQGVLELEVSA
jgi:hypothetical protein